MKARAYFLAGALLVTCCGGGASSTSTAPSPVPGPATLIGAGDIALCGSTYTAATATLIANTEGTIFTLGDNVYSSGTPEEFAQCYEPTWGRFKSRTYPTPGNHDYNTAGATGYFDYFGNRAGADRTGYFSYDLGAWHIVSLNSNVDASASSAQAAWLRQDLSQTRAGCILAYWHHPTFTSSPGYGGFGSDMREVWRILYAARADVILNGHHHVYERFAQQDPDGRADAGRGIREFIVGTGGHSLIPKTGSAPNSEVFSDQSFGVLKLTLDATSYRWDFIPVSGGTFTDSGSTQCLAK